MRRCTCEQYVLGTPYDVGQCRRCWRYHHEQRYHTHCGGTETLPAPPAFNVMAAIKHEVPLGSHVNKLAIKGVPCRHLGPSTGIFKRCVSCCMNVERELFQCGIHGQCSKDKAVTYRDTKEDGRTELVTPPWCFNCDKYDPALSGSFSVAG